MVDFYILQDVVECECSLCKTEIHDGEKHIKTLYKIDGDVLAKKYHPKCFFLFKAARFLFLKKHNKELSSENCFCINNLKDWCNKYNLNYDELCKIADENYKKTGGNNG